MPPKSTFPPCSPSRRPATGAQRSSVTPRRGGDGDSLSPAQLSPAGGALTPRMKVVAARDVGTTSLGGAPAYGDIVDSDLVHDEIRELGTQVKTMIAKHLPRHGTSKEQVMWGVREFGPSKESRRVLNKENDAARLAWETGVYCVWRCCEKPRLSGANQDFCCRIGYQHTCFCGHTMAAHTTPGRAANSSAAAQASGGGDSKAPGQDSRKGGTPTGGSSTSPVTDQRLAQWKAPCEEAGCPCARFRYVPNTPLEIGEGWLTRRANWKASEWSAKCRCSHGHKLHDPKTMRCKSCGGCSGFVSGFLCVVCDLPWEAHETVWESEGMRLREGHPVCEAYAPLADIDWDIREAVLTDVSMGGRIEAPATHLAIQQRSGNTGGDPNKTRAPSGRRALRSGRLSSTAGVMDQEGGSSSGILPSITASPAVDAILDAEYCRYCASVYKQPMSKFCSQCGQPRPQRPTTLR